MRRWLLACGVLLAGVAVGPSLASAADELRGDQVAVHLNADSSITLQRSGLAAQTFKPAFIVFFTPQDPQIALRPATIPHVTYSVTTWVNPDAKGDAKLADVDTKVTAGDGLDNSILKGDKTNRTANCFHASGSVTVQAKSAIIKNSEIDWTFDPQPGFELTASITLDQAATEPQLHFHLKPTTTGYYSVGYVGAPDADVKDIDEMWQPLIWTEKRFPDQPYLSAAFHCPVPAPMMTVGGVTTALVVPPAAIPFEPLPKFDNSQFGVAIRSESGRAQPAVFAPMLGGAGSLMKVGVPFDFTVGLLVQKGGCVETLFDLARRVYNFRDMRQNTLCSLDQTLENEIVYGMSQFSRFNDDLRGCAYDTDAPGTVKNVSSLHPLSIAMVTDDPEIYRKRAQPIMEFLLSRQKFLFTTDPKIKTQSPGYKMLGPCAPMSELTALYEISRGRDPMFLQLARNLVGTTRTLNLHEQEKGATWQNYLALYRAGGDPADLKKATQLADEYLAARLATKQTDFVDPQGKGMFFWSQFAPPFPELLELYEQTHEQRYLDAAHEGARRYCQYVWFDPLVTDASITVNKGGKAPEYGYLKKRGNGPMSVPEETVPEWRVSEAGLLSEASGTSTGHRAVLMANHAPWMLRIAQLTGDTFLHDVARDAVVGRYANFPGYHINTERTTVYEKPDYPMRPFRDMTYNSIHFNHIWPHISMVLDYLVSDVDTRSGGKIAFPSHYAEGYAYLKDKIYGDRSGHFYDASDVWLWMPAKLLTTDNVQLNYIAARGTDGLYLAFTNQSASDVTATVQLNHDLVGDVPAASLKVWKDNVPAGDATCEDGSFKITVAGNGITGVKITGVKIMPKFQLALQGDVKPLSDHSSTTLPYAGTHAMLLTMGQNLTHAYVYLQATPDELTGATLHYKAGGDWQAVSDNAYPYEFSVDVPDSVPQLDFWIEGKTPAGTTTRSDQATLVR